MRTFIFLMLLSGCAHQAHFINESVTWKEPTAEEIEYERTHIRSYERPPTAQELQAQSDAAEAKRARLNQSIAAGINAMDSYQQNQKLDRIENKVDSLPRR